MTLIANAIIGTRDK